MGEALPCRPVRSTSWLLDGSSCGRSSFPDPSEGHILVATEWSGISSGTELLAYRGEVDPDLPLDETLGALAGTFTYPFRYGYSAVGRVVQPAALPGGAAGLRLPPPSGPVRGRRREVVAVDDLDPRAATLYPTVETALQVCLDASRAWARRSWSWAWARSASWSRCSWPVPGRWCSGPIRSRPGRPPPGLRCPGRRPRRRAEVVAAETGRRGADLVVEVSGNPQALAASLGLLAHEGTAVICSWYGTKPVSPPLGAAFHRRRLALRSTQVSTLPAALTARWDRRRRAELAWRLARELPLAVLATHAFAFEQAAEAYACADRRKAV